MNGTAQPVRLPRLHCASQERCAGAQYGAVVHASPVMHRPAACDALPRVSALVLAAPLPLHSCPPPLTQALHGQLFPTATPEQPLPRVLALAPGLYLSSTTRQEFRCGRWVWGDVLSGGVATRLAEALIAHPAIDASRGCHAVHPCLPACLPACLPQGQADAAGAAGNARGPRDAPARPSPQHDLGERRAAPYQPSLLHSSACSCHFNFNGARAVGRLPIFRV